MQGPGWELGDETVTSEHSASLYTDRVRQERKNQQSRSITSGPSIVSFTPNAALELNRRA